MFVMIPISLILLIPVSLLTAKYSLRKQGLYTRWKLAYRTITIFTMYLLLMIWIIFIFFSESIFPEFQHSKGEAFGFFVELLPSYIILLGISTGISKLTLLKKSTSYNIIDVFFRGWWIAIGIVYILPFLIKLLLG